MLTQTNDWRRRVKSYILANIDVHDPERYKGYIQLAAPTVEQYGGRYLVRGGRAERLEGVNSVRRIAILQFPTYERAIEWWQSDEYRAAKTLRQEIASAEMFLVEGA